MAETQETPAGGVAADGEQRDVPDPRGVEFEQMRPVDPDGVWVKPQEGKPLLGTVLDIEDGHGKDGDSRLYKMMLGDCTYPALDEERDELGPGDVVVFYGAGDLDRQVDAGGISRGTILGILKTGETYPTDHGNDGYVFDVRKAEL